jgi:anti-sigma factor (TIGR02949 family)
MGKLIRWVGRTFNSKDNRCSEEEHCLELVRLMLDDESTEDDNAYVLKHIDGCYRCYDNFDVENAIREVIRQKNSNIEIPQDVVNEIREKIEVH